MDYHFRPVAGAVTKLM